MTEAEWLACDDPIPMLEFLSGRVSERKLRLFACACCRRIWRAFRDRDARAAVEVSERYADGRADSEVLQAARRKARWTSRIIAEMVSCRAAGAAWRSTWADPCQAASATSCAVQDVQNRRWHWNWSRRPCPKEVEARAHSRLLREIAGNPCRAVVLDRAWQTPTVIALAQAAYEERLLPSGALDASRLAVLSDALEEAGCSDPDVLSHLRSPGPHVRGCWALDLVRSVD